MADDNTFRSIRSKGSPRGDTQPSDPGDDGRDPLAELARLIGQGDPFSDFGQRATRSEPRERHSAPADTGFARHDPYRMASAIEEPIDPPRATEPAPIYHRREPQLAAAHPLRPRQGAYAPANDPRTSYLQPSYVEDGAAMAPQDDEFYDDPPRLHRRSGLFTVVMLIGFAMIGTAAAYGYRTYYVAPSVSKAPPVITAEATPSKVVPAGDSQTGKMMQDRVREPVRNERLVSREEQPVDTWNQPPRVVLPPPVLPSRSAPAPAKAAPPVTNGPPASAPTQAAAQTGGANEPKRIRTVPIRPDGADSRGVPTTPLARNTGPLSLDPLANASAQPGPRDRVAAAQPTTTQAVPAQPPAPRLAAAPTGGAGYLVQLSSQRSEAEAQASYRALQTKFPDQLGGHSPIVKRVDLGAKGIYYRAMVGPFASPSDADQFCTGLRAAGGQCFIQRN